MKYFYGILAAVATMIIFRTAFSYFEYDGEFLTGWFSCMAYMLVLEYHEKRRLR